MQNYNLEKGQFVPEEHTDYIFTTTNFEGGLITIEVAFLVIASITILNLVLLIIIWRKLNRIDSKLEGLKQ